MIDNLYTARKHLLASAAALAISVVVAGPFNPAEAQSAFNWSGFYVGASIGSGGSRFASEISENGQNEIGIGLVFGVQGGYNWQSGNLVYGIEGDFSYAHMKMSISDNSFKTDLLASIRGRLGMSFDRILVYGTAGFGFTRSQVATSEGGWKKYNRYRPVLGAGLEFAAANNLILRGEFLDYIGKDPVGNEDSGGNKLKNIYMFRFGVNYKF